MVNCNNGVSVGGGVLTGNNGGTGRLSLPLPLTACHRCDVCGKLLSTKLTLKRHKEQQHLQPLNNAVCNLCHKVFRTLNSLNNHKSIYHRRQKQHTGHHHAPHAHNLHHNRHSSVSPQPMQMQMQMQSATQLHQDQHRPHHLPHSNIDFL